jgi:hypothetical protein
LQPPLPKGTLAKDEPKWVTFSGDVLTPEDYTNIAAFWFDDDVGAHFHSFCYALQPAQKGGMVIFASCREHTNEGDMPGWFMRFFR